MRSNGLVKAEAYDIAQYGRGVYVGFDRDPEWKARPYVFAAWRAGREIEVHVRLQDVHKTWAEREAEDERELEREQQISTNEQTLIEFFEKQGLLAMRRRRFSSTEDSQHIRVEAAEDIDQSWLEMRWSTLQELLANAREVSDDLVAAEGKAK